MIISMNKTARRRLRDSGEYADVSEENSRQADMFGFDDIDQETIDPETFETNEAHGPDEEDEVELSRTVMDGSWAKKLFRRAAQALHPDREPDPTRRESKQARLRELLAARKQDDIMAMLTIYSESVSDADIVLAEQEMTEVCDALQNQLDALRMDQEEYYPFPSAPQTGLRSALRQHNQRTPAPDSGMGAGVEARGPPAGAGSSRCCAISMV